MTVIDPVELTQALVRCPSVTPADAGALGLVETALAHLGFICSRQVFAAPGTAPVDNLYARLGTVAPCLVFAGHTDVVPPGDAARWSVDPFSGEIRDGMIWGRGAADMKSGVACMVAATARFLSDHGPLRHGSIAFLITGDEEAVAINGTKALLDWAHARGERFDACIVGEPTSPERVGEMMKVGRRGSLTGKIVVSGVQGHTAYPQRADNPVHRLVAMLARLTADPIDEGTAHFQPSNLQLTTIDVGNPAGNVIPAEAKAAFNIRYNDLHDAASLEAWVRERLDAAGGSYTLDIVNSGEAFLTEPGKLTALVTESIEAVTGLTPEHSTRGGTSDARFIKDFCPVVEFGLAGQTMHKVDERVAVADILQLTQVYLDFLRRFFAPA